ncbi:DUF1631 family protein [Hydrogenophaga sp.]|uniref:DUF1631 family protein n=1 Tax=Hydrogenophaga sp. TaxID=1904254 RepID=UPI0026365114|nr:DUF1631 family protein [Hydrogenophaga sp.]MCW5653454.1 DUF1631 family protein [Hydrogenophaga sp.]
MDDRNSQAYDACLKEALAQTREWMPRWLSHLQSALRDRESSASQMHEKQLLIEARRALEGQRERIATGFLAAMAESVERSLPRGGSATGRRPQSVSFDELELMGDDQVQETVELARVQQVVQMSVDEEQLALTALLSTARGFEVINQDANPLRAEIIVAALMNTLKGLKVEPAVRARWLQAGALSLGNELRDVYVHLSLLLDQMGIEPAGYAVIQAPESRQAPMAAPANERPAGAAGEETNDGDVVLTLDHLHQLLVGNLDQAGSDAPSDQGASGSGNAMVRTLASEVVSLMLKRIAADERLLPAVRDMLQDMKPALLQLARSEPRFFADRQNPARRMLDAITERSLAFTTEQDRGYGPFAAQVRKILQAVQKPGPDISDRLEGLLAELNRSQEEAVAPAQAQARGLAVQTLVRVEQRHLLAERVAGEIRGRNDYEKAPGVVRRFLTSAWSQVIAQARLEEADKPPLKPGESPASRYGDILPDLLWSSQLALASLNRPRLVKVIPSVLRTLREGLDSIEYPREQTEAFFQALMGLHEAAYKTQRSEPPRGSAPGDDPPSVQPEQDDDPWIPRTEARDSCLMEDAFVDSPPLTSTQPAFQETMPMQRDWADLKAEMAGQRGAALAVGTWVDIYQDGQAIRWQITWASPHGTLFLFTGDDGRSLSMTKRGLERLMEQNRLRVVADHGVVDEALDEVARQAWLNSAKTKS